MRRKSNKAERDLATELAETRLRLAEAEEMLAAIRSGEVDALVVSGPSGERVFSLEGAETPYRSLVEAINEGALFLAPNATILFANTRFAEMVETPLEQIIGGRWQPFFLSAEHLRFEELLRAAKHGGVRGEFQLQSREGADQTVEVSLSSVVRERTEGIVAIVTSLAERKSAEAALREANRELAAQTIKLREMVTEMQHVSYSISHDMRAPLRAMQGFASFLLEESVTHAWSAEAQSYCQRIMVAATRLDKLIQDALSYTKTVLLEVPLQSVNLSALVRSLTETYPNLSSNLAEIRIEGTLPSVLGNEALLTQCFSNLLGNAVKFVTPGTRPSVRIYAQAGEELIRIWVEDNGIGIPEQGQARLFGMFQRLTHEHEGTGIGLAIVRKVVERMGGQVGVFSEPGKGSRFWVDLHAVPADHGREV